MEEKDSEISGPCEEFRICFCGEVPLGSVAWYCIDVSEKTESSTKKLNSFSATHHFPSVYYASLNGCIYSLGGQWSSYIYSLGGQWSSYIYSLGGQWSGRTLLNDVWILDIKSLDSFAARVEEKLMWLKLEEPEFEKPKDPEMSLGPELSFSAWEAGKPEERSFSFWEPEKPKEPEKPEEPEKPKPSQAPEKSKELEEKMLHSLWLAQVRRACLPWIDGPSMTFARCNPHTMVVDQKLYVLGGFEPNQNQANGWIEVFDPEEKKWESLPSPPDQIHSSVMISGLLKAKKEIIIAKQRWDRDPMKFYFYNITTRSWSEPLEREAKVRLPPNAGRAVTVGNTLYWISTEEHNHECIIRAYDLDRNMWFEDHLNPATIFGLRGMREHFSSIYSSRPGFLHLRDQKFCLLLQSSIKKDYPESSIMYLYCVTLDISPIYEHENRGKFELTNVSVQKYCMDRYINFLDCMLVDRVSGVESEVESVDRRRQSTSTTSVSSRMSGELE